MPLLSYVGGSLEISGTTLYRTYDVGYIGSVNIGSGLSSSSPSGLQVLGMIRIGTNVNQNSQGVNVVTPINSVIIYNLQSAATLLIECTDGTINNVAVWGWRNKLTLAGSATSSYSGSHASDGLTISLPLTSTSAYETAQINTVSIQGLKVASSINILCQLGTISTVNINTGVTGQLTTDVYNGINIK